MVEQPLRDPEFKGLNLAIAGNDLKVCDEKGPML